LTVAGKERIGAVGMGERREVPRTGGLEGSKLSFHLQMGETLEALQYLTYFGVARCNGGVV
jgi:hypothetical protein